jgi:hypothetical protein
MRRHLSFANVMSCLALFVALGGAGYAATLPRDSVVSNQIRPGAVAASEVRDGSLGVNEFLPGAIQLGSGYQIVKKLSTVANQQAGTVAQCGPGRKVIGGGAKVRYLSVNPSTRGVAVQISAPNGTTGWQGSAWGHGEPNHPQWGLEVYAICTRMG